VADDEQPASPFPWGLTPGGTPDEVTPVRPPTPAPPLDQGHFVAVPEPQALPVQPAQPVPPVQPASWDLPTQAVAAVPDDGLPTEAYSIAPQQYVHPNDPPSAYRQPTVENPVQPEPVPSDPPEANALESLFGEENFVEYEPGPMASENPFQRPAAAPVGELVPVPVEPRAPIARTQKILMGVAGGLVVLLALVALFFVGTRMSPAFAPAAAVVTAPSVAPTVEPEVLGPVVPGSYGWDELLGTECLEPFGSPWDQEFTVVDCTQPHAAQLVARGVLDDELTAAYPGVEELTARLATVCTADKVLDFSLTADIDDLQVSASFPASEQDWIDGGRDYFCFATRSGGEPLTQNIAQPDVLTPAAQNEN
jgi:hypothetical protein